MKPSSLSVVVVTAVLITLCTSFSSGKGASLPARQKRTFSGSASMERSGPVKYEQYYYWYLASNGAYDGFRPVSQEIAQMENELGVFCDTDVAGGSLVSKGYALPLPTLIWPSQLIFAHY
jgi:hypothetical protein